METKLADLIDLVRRRLYGRPEQDVTKYVYGKSTSDGAIVTVIFDDSVSDNYVTSHAIIYARIFADDPEINSVHVYSEVRGWRPGSDDYILYNKKDGFLTL